MLGRFSTVFSQAAFAVSAHMYKNESLQEGPQP